jgi:hypothetical protein
LRIVDVLFYDQIYDTQPANIISTGRLSSPESYAGDEPLFDEPTFLINNGSQLNIYDFNF